MYVTKPQTRISPSCHFPALEVTKTFLVCVPQEFQWDVQIVTLSHSTSLAFWRTGSSSLATWSTDSTSAAMFN